MLEDRPEARVVARGLRSRLGRGSREVGAGAGQVVLDPLDPPGEDVLLRDRAGKCSAGGGLLAFNLASSVLYFAASACARASLSASLSRSALSAAERSRGVPGVAIAER